MTRFVVYAFLMLAVSAARKVAAQEIEVGAGPKLLNILVAPVNPKAKLLPAKPLKLDSPKPVTSTVYVNDKSDLKIDMTAGDIDQYVYLNGTLPAVPYAKKAAAKAIGPCGSTCTGYQGVRSISVANTGSKGALIMDCIKSPILDIVLSGEDAKVMLCDIISSAVNVQLNGERAAVSVLGPQVTTINVDSNCDGCIVKYSYPKAVCNKQDTKPWASCVLDATLQPFSAIGIAG